VAGAGLWRPSRWKCCSFWLERPGALISRDDIGKRLWRDVVFVDVDAGIHSAILRVRRGLGDRPESPRFIETVPGKGYRFIAPVWRIAATTPEPSNRPPAPPRPVESRRQALPAERRGQTRLALRLAAGFVETFRDGVSFVDLAPISDAHLIPEVTAARLGIRESARRSTRDALFAYLGARGLLLVLDTCEHLIDGCAALTEDLLSAALGLRVIATAREALRVRGEVVFQVPPLSLPPASAVLSQNCLHAYESTQLFVDRAQAVDGRTRQQGDLDPATVMRICHRLDGVPLAIELAAAQVGVLTAEQIERKPEDRFRLLSGSRTAVARQRTLEATVGWSYDLLSEPDRRVFCRLAVFPSSWTIEAADYVCAGGGDADDMLDLLSRLVNKSLVTIDGGFGEERRYRFLETVHHYARQRLQLAGDEDALRDRHFEFFYETFRDGLRL
jgi:non-specific serine/threonine protein kinase